MADILERVQKAGQVALNTYLKEHATHRLARLTALVEDELSLALEDVYPGTSEHLKVPSKRKEIYTNALKEILSLDRVPTYRNRFKNNTSGDALLERFLFHLKQEDAYIIEEFAKILHHFRQAQLVVRGINENPLVDHEEMEKADTITAHLEGMYSDAVERSMEMMQRLEFEEKNGSRRQPEVLILQGGGAKGMAYSGVVQVLEDANMLKGIKRVAGTSAGALMGLPIALGYSASEIDEIVTNSRFAQFYAEGTLKFKTATALVEMTSKKELDSHAWHEGDLLNTFSEHYFLPELAKRSNLNIKEWTTWTEDRVQQELKRLDQVNRPGGQYSLKEIYEVAMASFKVDQIAQKRSTDALHFEGLLGRSKAFQAALTCIRVKRPYAVTQSDSIEEFIGDIIQERLKVVLDAHFDLLDPPIKTLADRRNITFTQLKALSEMDESYGFKEFGVAVTDSYMPITLSNIKRKITRDKSLKGERAPDPGTGDYDSGGDFKPVFVRASSEHHTYTDMPIKKAVRASMNLPFVFKAMKYNGLRMVDGGLATNFPHKMFADAYATQEEVRANTIGFMLSALEDNIENEALQDLARNGIKPLAIEVEFEQETMGQKLTKVKDGLLNPVGVLKGVVGSALGNAMSVGVKKLMRANAMPSMETLENVGLVNTGTVGTGDFHVSKAERQALHQAGVTSALNLLRWDADKHLRFAMGRLISLSTIEDKLLQERGLAPNLKLPMEALRDSECLTKSLMGGVNKFNLATVVLGKAKQLKPLPPTQSLNNIVNPSDIRF